MSRFHRFRPSVAATLAAFFLLPLLVGLGFWQLDRAEQKRELLSKLRANAQDAAIAVDGGLGQLGDFRFRRAVASGRYLQGRQILLDNQIEAQRVGYHVFTPLELAGGGGVVLLVNRGWVSLGSSRTQRPAVPAPAGSVTVHGLLNTPPAVGMRLGRGAVAGADWPQVWTYLDTQAVGQALDRRVLPYVLLLDRDDPGGYVRNWRVSGTPPEKNLGYAFQWFAMAAMLVLLYVWLSLRRGGSEQANG